MINVTIEHGRALIGSMRQQDSGPRSPVPVVGVAVPASGLVEARGALLCWDFTTPERYPHALVHDPDEATGWLWELYGDQVADAVLAAYQGESSEVSEAGIPLPETTEQRDRLHRLAALGWAEAWWPASTRAGIPALSRGLLAAETALATAAVEHLLEDEDAVERALEPVASMLAALRALESSAPGSSAAGSSVAGSWPFADEAGQLAEALRELAEDRGRYVPEHTPGTVAAREPEPEHAGGPDDWALAAGGDEPTAGGHQSTGAEQAIGRLALASGSAATGWSGLGPQTLDAASEAEWSILRRDGGTRLLVTAPAAPEVRYPVPETPPAPVLAARFGPADRGVRLWLRRDGQGFGGETELPPSALLLPTAERTLSIVDPRLAGEHDPEPAAMDPAPEVRAALLAYARARLADPSASLAERVAGAGGGQG